MNYSISPDRRTLTITADKGERANLHKLGDSIHQDSTLHDVLEHIVCNSSLDWVDPEWTGDLTEAPMLGIVEWSKPTERGYEVSERWAFMSYQVRSLLEDLRDKGEVVRSWRISRLNSRGSVSTRDESACAVHPV